MSIISITVFCVDEPIHSYVTDTRQTQTNACRVGVPAMKMQSVLTHREALSASVDLASHKMESQTV